MLGAIYVGMSGLAAYSSGLRAISNNVGNLNSSGFKAETVNFTDLFAQDRGNLTSSDENNARGLGYGVRMTEPRTDFSQGDLRASTGDLDLAISGTGFFVLLGADKTFYTRTGLFEVDKDGFIAQQNTQNRLGVLDDAGRITTLNINSDRTSPAVATSKIIFADNLSSGGTDHSISDLAVYDSVGSKHIWAVKFTKGATQGLSTDWAVTVTDETQRTVGTGTLKFIGSTVDPSTATLVIADAPAGADPLSVTLDFSANVTSFSGSTTSTLRAAKVDGHALGQLTTVTVDEDGKVKLTYSNGESKTPNAVALADFRDPQALEKSGNGLYELRGDSEHRFLASGKEGVGKIVSKQIEASNVDLSAAFGDLILIQRGFQASSQVISVANDMIQQLFGIRGQG